MNLSLRINAGGLVSRKAYVLLLAWFALNLLPQALAQTASDANSGAVDVSAWPNGYLSVNQGWRTRAGDDAAYAQPGYDDSGWQVITLGDPSIAGQGYRWYRIRIKLPASHPPMALVLTAEEGAFEAFANGIPIGGYRIGPNLGVRHPRPLLIQLPDQPHNQFGIVTVAVRTKVYPYSALVGSWRTFSSASIGPLQTMSLVASSAQSASVLKAVSSLAIELAVCLASLGVLGLFFGQRSNREYLWLSLYLFLLGFSELLLMLVWATLVAYSWNVLLASRLLYVLFIPQIEFTFAFVHKRVGRAWRTYEAILVACALITGLIGWYAVFPQTYFSIEIVSQIPAFVGLPVALILWFRQGNREAGWLIFPSLLPGVAVALDNFLTIQTLLGAHRFDAFRELLQFYIGPVLFLTEAVSHLLFLLAIGIVLFFRHTHVSRMQARSAAELDAASDMQRRLIPQQLPVVEGCEIQAAYMPATEVGGDFYQVLRQPDDSALIVVGDVSGKGLKAAMTGALAIGALRTLAAENMAPAAILTRLNEQMVDASQGGFITCLCILFHADGNLTLANAGHLSPYLNGHEILCENALPLGLAPGMNYAETTLQLQPGDRLTLLTDGVLEARSATGELFGFDRTQAISAQAAEAIAGAAQAFGQDDDITVLTLGFAPAEVANA
jgi:sigma-B regulation protein RsbU (phosphoserine phosphatase)